MYHLYCAVSGDPVKISSEELFILQAAEKIRQAGDAAVGTMYAAGIFAKEAAIKAACERFAASRAGIK